MSFLGNTRKPEGQGGKVMVSLMNLCHTPMADWGLRFLHTDADGKVLDCGCGGGANIKRLLKRCPQGVVKGIDYSPVSVAKAEDQPDRCFGGPLHGGAGQRGGYAVCGRVVRCGHGL